MNPPLDEDSLAGTSPAQIHSALFAQLVTGHAQIAMMFLGRYPNPQTGQIEPPTPEAAKVYIDQLEMIEAKTKGNLLPEEARLLRQMLSASRLAFADVIEEQLEKGSAPAAPATEQPEVKTAEGAAPEDDSKVKFSKKYE